MTSRILASVGLGNLFFGLFDLGRVSFNLEATSLFSDGVYEGRGEGAIGWAR